MPPYKTIALLPMKAHSARVIGKNFRPFAGKPLFAWVLESLLSISEIDHIFINTDARSILETHPYVKSDRVTLRDRPEALCGDTVSMNLVLANDVEGIDSETYVMTHTTNPLLSVGTIRSALSAYRGGVVAGRCDSLFTVNQVQSRFYRADGSAVNHDPARLIRTQDLEPWFQENSNLYLFSRESFKQTHARIGLKPMMYATPVIESLDIDDQDGWEIAEAVARGRRSAAVS